MFDAMNAGWAGFAPGHGCHAMAGHHHRGRGRGGGPGRGLPFGPGFPGGPAFRGGPRARRGDVRAAALVLLAEEPRNGYQLMQAIEDRSGGAWRPSPGSVYPALSQLEDEGLVRVEPVDGGKRFELTDAGRAYVEEHRDRLGTPWDAMARGWDAGSSDLMDLARQVGMAVMQVLQAGSPAQKERAREVLADARRRLYGILAEDEPREDPPAPGES
jgi:DNA-binding PadR family transcriptional regulator